MVGRTVASSVTPSPLRESRCPAADGLEKGGLSNALNQDGMTTRSRIWHCDEMRFGLWGQVRRRWGLKGKKIIQRMQIVFRWSYLVLAVDVLRGELHWGWSQGMNQQQLVPIFEQWPMDGVVLPVIEVNLWANWALGERFYRPTRQN